MYAIATLLEDGFTHPLTLLVLLMLLAAAWMTARAFADKLDGDLTAFAKRFPVAVETPLPRRTLATARRDATAAHRTPRDIGAANGTPPALRSGRRAHRIRPTPPPPLLRG